MAIVRWDPFREMMTLRNVMDRMFEDSMVRRLQSATDGTEGFLPLDMYQTDNEVVIKASLPGMKPENVDISITGDVLTIRAEQQQEEEAKDENYIVRERRYGSTTRAIQIPVAVQGDKAEATFENGILVLTLPKAEEVKPKQIKVTPKATIEGGKK